jgi:uncharacterized protein (DUF4415 family)
MSKWPSFETHDLDDTEEASAEMERRWHVYDREMKALIAKGGVHQDDDGWWVETATGELIGPDPEIERPVTSDDLVRVAPLAEVQPELATRFEQARKAGRPPLENPKVPVSMRLDRDVLDSLKAGGRGWQTRANEMLRKSLGL